MPTYAELRKIAKPLGLPIHHSKERLLQEIENQKNEKYQRQKRIGTQGKEGTTYLVRKGRKEYAMKTFRKTKSSANIKKEYELQKMASSKKICPQVYDYDTEKKYIVMEKMDYHLYDLIIKQKNSLTKNQQLRILEIYRKLDDSGVFHDDANLYNYMVKDDEIYIIDFGMAKMITPSLVKTLKTERPNSTYMPIGFILEFQRHFGKCDKGYSYIMNAIKKDHKRSLTDSNLT